MRYFAVSRNVPLYVGERRSIFQAVLFSFGCLRLLGHRFDAIEADQMPYLPLFPLRLVASIKRVPLIVTWHEVWGAAYWREYLGPAGVVGAVLERLAMRTPDLIVAENAETHRRLLEAGLPETRVTVVPNGVDMYGHRRRTAVAGDVRPDLRGAPARAQAGRRSARCRRSPPARRGRADVRDRGRRPRTRAPRSDRG